MPKMDGQPEIINRKEKDGTTQEVICSEILKSFNQHVGYVDKLDMLKYLYEIDRNSKRK